MKNKQNLKVLKSRRQHNLLLENYPLFIGLVAFAMKASLFLMVKVLVGKMFV